MDRLSDITYRLPASPAAASFLELLGRLLADVGYAEAVPGRVVLTPPWPAGARPRTVFAAADVPAPEVVFDGGPAIRVPGGTPEDPATLVAMTELVDRLRGHVRRVDHTGVNLADAGRWQELVGALAGRTTMYRYPTGEPWPFVLPSTAAELDGDVRDFRIGREPRFELVRADGLARVEWQFALSTDLTRARLEAMFPAGSTLPGLADIFRVVRVRHPWAGLGIRMDLGYRVEDGPDDWVTGEWLVTAGGRMDGEAPRR